MQATFPNAMFGGPQMPAFMDTVMNLTGIKHLPDSNGGAPNCVSLTPLVSLHVWSVIDIAH